jgi:S-methylmethionine-dependent homocysteine/selenocysteine methylase
MPTSRRDAVAHLLSSRTFLTFGGCETYLLFIQGYPLREFCAFEVVDDEAAWKRLGDELVRPTADAAAEHGLGLIADCFVWRASPDYVERLGHSARGVAAVNRGAVERTRALLDDWRTSSPQARACPVLVAAEVGPRGDGYAIGSGGPVTPTAAYDYHAPQIEALAAAGVDLVAALTMTSVSEALGVVRAAERAGLPVLVSPTVETDGRVPDESELGELIAVVDDATGGAPVGYMANCAHPSHLAPALSRAASSGASWLSRFRGLRANASAMSHAELDESTELDRGTPVELAQQLGELQRSFGFTVVGGCCGTDAEHLRLIAEACA